MMVFRLVSLLCKQEPGKVALLLLFMFISSKILADTLGHLPVPIANNAVASAQVNGDEVIYSFNGLQSGRDWQHVSNLVMAFNLRTGKSWRVDKVPYKDGRLASVAATVNNKIYLFGGYTVASDYSEKSTPEVYQFDPVSETFNQFGVMPVPVDDSVALVYKERYIYLVSGWHDVGNVKQVQVLDTRTAQWQQATPFPGAPVFGQAAGIVGNQLVIVDGVKVAAVVDGKRKYAMSPASWSGDIDPEDFTKIHWKQLPQHPGPALYRAAAVGDVERQVILFAGGSENPYNFNGIGYNGVPSEPSSGVIAWDLKHRQWLELAKMPIASMDHRALLLQAQDCIVAGGMHAAQQVTSAVSRWRCELPPGAPVRPELSGH